MSDFWDAASAIATAAATIVALALGLDEVRARRKENTDREVGQARLVVSELDCTTASVTNHSCEPLLELRIIRAEAEVNSQPVTICWPEQSHRIFHNVAPGQTLFLELTTTLWGQYTPEGEVHPREDHGYIPSPATDPRLTIQFIDARGLRWQRIGLRPPTRLLDELSPPAPNPHQPP
ncbi:hypothetical protein ACFWIB_39760 [Streptomyces sp. NPDC127051]|uniref:hypothetical protein n=1 Tax=Streptomyces sp. NPDC127051 TaxID=3347119 RepID=UPI0036669D3B